MLCSYCQSITIEGLVGKVEEREGAAEYKGMNHHPSFGDLVESARNCELCHLFYRSMLEHSPEDKSDDNSSQQVILWADNGNLRRWPASSDGFSNLQIRQITVMTEG